jgi:hypothetical protein
MPIIVLIRDLQHMRPNPRIDDSLQEAQEALLLRKPFFVDRR